MNFLKDFHYINKYFKIKKCLYVSFLLYDNKISIQPNLKTFIIFIYFFFIHINSLLFKIIYSRITIHCIKKQTKSRTWLTEFSWNISKKNFQVKQIQQKIDRRSNRFLVKMEPHGAYVTGPPWNSNERSFPSFYISTLSPPPRRITVERNAGGIFLTHFPLTFNRNTSNYLFLLRRFQRQQQKRRRKFEAFAAGKASRDRKT